MLTPLDEFWWAAGIAAIAAGAHIARNRGWGNVHLINLLQWQLILLVPIAAVPSAIAYVRTTYPDIGLVWFFTPYIVAIICLGYTVWHNSENYSAIDMRLVYPTFTVISVFWIALGILMFWFLWVFNAL